jgi:hypothetical protein
VEQVANDNIYGFFYLISKIEPLRQLCQSFNKLENKHIRWFGLQYLHTLYFIFLWWEENLDAITKISSSYRFIVTKDLFTLKNKIQRITILQQVLLLLYLQKCLEPLVSKPLLQLGHVDCLDQIQAHSGHMHV